MPPKVETKSELPIEYLLSYQYDPAGYTQAVFRRHYQKLVEHRDDLRKHFNDKEERRASRKQADGKNINKQRSRRLTDLLSASPPKGSRFSSLPDDDDGSSSSALPKPTISATLSKTKLNKLPQHERKPVVTEIRKEVETMKAEMKVQKKKDNGARNEAENAKEQNDHQKTAKEDPDETNELGQDQG